VVEQQRKYRVHFTEDLLGQIRKRKIKQANKPKTNRLAPNVLQKKKKKTEEKGLPGYNSV
jgi:hypothetical protein